MALVLKAGRGHGGQLRLSTVRGRERLLLECAASLEEEAPGLKRSRREVEAWPIGQCRTCRKALRGQETLRGHCLKVNVKLETCWKPEMLEVPELWNICQGELVEAFKSVLSPPLGPMSQVHGLFNNKDLWSTSGR